MTRALQPTDLIRLSFSELRKLPNLAKARNRIGRNTLSLSDMFLTRPWVSMNGHRQTRVQTKGLRVKGLVSARRRGGPSVWEIDYLVLSPELLDKEMDLLHGLSLGAARCGVDRIFIRLGSEGHLLDAVDSAGFSFYMDERLYRLDRRDGTTTRYRVRSERPLQPKTPAEEYGIFQLYDSSFPICVREAEGQTLDEWQESRERGWGRRGGREYVLLENASVTGWIKVASDGKNGYLDLMVSPDAEDIDDLLDVAEAKLSGCSTLWSIVSEFQMPLCRVLEERGYKIVEEYATAVRHITAKVRRPSLVPIGVK